MITARPSMNRRLPAVAVVLALAGLACGGCALLFDSDNDCTVLERITLTEGQVLGFYGVADTLLIACGETAYFTWCDSVLYMGNGRRKIQIRPFLPDPYPDPPPTVEQIQSFQETLADVPRIQELLEGNPDADDPYVWWEACETWFEEAVDLAESVKYHYAAYEGSDWEFIAEECADMLRASPQVEPETVEVVASPPEFQLTEIRYYLRGFGVGSLLQLYSEYQGPPVPRTSIMLEEARELRLLLQYLFDTGNPYYIDLGRGIFADYEGGLDYDCGSREWLVDHGDPWP